MVNKIILITRNPLDSIPSLFNMIATGSHSDSMPQNIEQKTSELWEKFVVKEPPVWNEFHQFWVENSQKINLHITRYEDLMTQPLECITDLSKFVFEVNSVENTVLHQMIKAAINENVQLYKPRKGKIGGSIDMFDK